MANEDRQKLFKAINKAGYDIGSYDDFDRRMNNAEDREKFYTAVNEAGYDIGSKDDFERRISPSKYKITVGGNDVAVSEREYMDFLRRHPGNTTAQPKPQQTPVAKPHEKSHPQAVLEAPDNPVLGTPWGSEGSATGKSRAFQSFAPRQVRRNEKVDATQFGTPYRPDTQLTAAQRDEIYRQNDYAVKQVRAMQNERKRRSQPLVDTGIPEANNSVIKTKGQWEDDLQEGASRISGSVVAPAVSKAIEDFDKKAHDVFESTQEDGNAMGGLPTGTASGATIFGSIRESNETKDPEKVLEYLKGQMEGLYKDQSFIETVGKEADKAGIDRGEYLEKVIKPQIEADLQKQFDSAMIDRYLPRSGKEYVVSGLSNSIIGMLSDAFLETKGQRAYKNQAAAMTDEGNNPYYNPGTGARLSQMGVSFAADAPFFGVYGRVSGQVAKQIAERQIKGMMAKGLSESAARSIVGTALENSVGARMKNYLMQHVVSSSLTLGAYNATSEAARQTRDKEGYDLGKIAGSTVEGMATGTAFGATGTVTQALSQPLRGIWKVGAKAAGFGAEAETMYATEELAKLAHGEDAFDNPFEGGVEAIEKLGVMKLSGGHLLDSAGKKLMRAREVGAKQTAAETLAGLLGPNRTGVKFTQEEQEYIRNFAEGRNLVEALSQIHPEVAVSEVNGKKKLTKEGEALRQRLADNYNAFMSNPEYPATLKQKVAGMLGGIYRPGLETGADIIHNSDGSVILKTRDKDGNCIREMKFDSFSDANAWRDNCEDEFRLNDAVNGWNGTSEKNRRAAVTEISELLGVSWQEAKDMVYKALERNDTSLDRDLYSTIFNAVVRNAYPEDEYNPQRRYQEGSKLTAMDRHFAQVDLQLAEERIALIGPEFARDVTDNVEYADEKMAEIAANPSYGKEEIEAARDYYNAVAKVSGMMDEALKGIDDQVEAENARVRRNTHTDSGSLIEADYRDGHYYVTAGHFQLSPDGRLVPTDNSGLVILRDRNTGEIVTANPRDVTVSGVYDPSRIMAENDSMDGLRGRLMKEADDSIELHPDTPEAPQEAGEIFKGADGKTYMVNPVPDEAGNMVWTKVEVELDEGGNPANIKGEPQPLDIDEYRKAKSDEIDEANRPQEEVTEPQPEAEPAAFPSAEAPAESPVPEKTEIEKELEGRLNGGINTAVDNSQQASAASRIPVDEKGRRQYEHARPEDTLAELTAKYGEEGAQQFAGKMAGNTARALDELLQKDTSKMTDANDLEAYNDEVAALRKKADYWKGLVPKELESEPLQIAKTGETEYRLSDEIDENGHQFVLTNNGDLAFGEISQDTGLTSAPILLSEGVITNPARNEGYGLVHIEARHGDQIRKAGYNSVIDFVEDVAKNWQTIREGRDRDGNKTYLLQLTDKHNNTLLIELSGDGSYWNVNTAGIFKTSYGAKRNVVYNRHTTDKQPAETAEASLSGEQSGTAPSTRMNAPIQQTAVSVGKDTKNTVTNQGNRLKNSPDGEISAPQQPAQPSMPPAKAKLYQKTVEDNTGRTFTYTDASGVRSELTVQRIDHEGNAVVTRQDYDAQGNRIGEAREERYPFHHAGEAIISGSWKKVLDTDEELRQNYKYHNRKVGDVPVIDVLTDGEKQQMLDALRRGDMEAAGRLEGDLINSHRSDLILRGREIRNEKVDRAMSRSGRGERLRGVRRQYGGFSNALSILEDSAMEPRSIEEYVADALGDVPRAGNGFLAYESYEKGGNKIVGLKDESGFGKRGFSGETKGFNPWLAPKGQGISLKQFAEKIHESLPEGLKEQISDQDIRNVINNVMTGAEKPSDISNYILKNRLAEAEAEARHEEDGWMEAPSFQKVVSDDSFAGRLERAEQQTETEPTEGQKRAGNYRKGHIRIAGLNISIENPKGSVRRGTDADGKSWEQQMHNTYGYIRGTQGADGDYIDVFLSDDPTRSNKVYIVQQRKKINGAWEFDELKVLLGFDDAAQASNAYLSNYEKGWEGMHALLETDIDSFKDWLKNGKQEGAYKEDGAWTKIYPGVSDMVADERQMPKPEQQEMEVLRGEGNNRLQGMGGELPEVSGGRGQTAIPQSDTGQNRRERELLQGELQVDGLDNPITEPKDGSLPDVQGQDNVNAAVGRGNGAPAEEDKVQNPDVPLGRRQDTGNSRRDQGQLQNDNISGQNNENGGLGERTQSELQNAEKQDKAGLDNGKDSHDTDEHKADGEALSPDSQEKALRDAVVEHLRSKGIEVSTDWQEGQRILDEYNGNGPIKKMGQKTIKKKAQIAADLEGNELTPEQQAVVDVYTGKSNNSTLSFTRDGKQRRVIMRKGNEVRAGAEHSLFRHYGTTEGVISSEDVLRIPDVLATGERTPVKRGKTQLYEYTLTDANGVKYTVVTENKHGREEFADFYTNKKGDISRTSTPSEEARASDTDNALSGAKVQQNSETSKDSGRKFFKTPDGHAYGYTYKGKLYIDPRIATAETPVHEYGHLWCEMKRNTAPEEWYQTKQVMLTDKMVQPIIERVRRDYPELAREGKEDDFIEEVITQFSGKRGAERLKAIADEVAAERGGIFGKAGAVTAMQRLKNILNRFWEGVASMMGWKYRNASQIADRMMADMLNGVNPRERMKDTQRNVKEAKGVSMNAKSVRIPEKQIEDLYTEGLKPVDAINMQDRVLNMSPRELIEQYRRVNSQMLDENGLDIDQQEDAFRRKWADEHGWPPAEGSGFGKASADYMKSLADKYTYNKMVLRWDLLDRIKELGLEDYIDKGAGEIPDAKTAEFIRMQMVGRRGASEADRAEGTDSRMEGNRIAKDMEKAGKDAGAIKYATGWERGTDGQWRYEIPDADADVLSKYKAKVAEMKDEGVKNPMPILKVGDLLGDDAELFRYYPELKKTDVLFSETLPDGTSGLFDGSNIELNAKEARRFEGDELNNESIYGTLLHEVQHAIQDIEGFAKGGSLMTSTTEEGISAIIVKKERQRADIKTKLDANRRILDDPEELQGAAELEGKTVNEVKEQLKETVGQQAEEYDNLGLQIERLKHTKAPTMSDARDLYHRLAGEVESRNVTERMGMTDEQRRQSPASETEDVPREEQVVIDGEGNENNSLKFQRTVSPEPEMTPEERQYWNQWDKAMKKWREKNAIPDDMTQAPEKPRFQPGENAMDYAKKLLEWNRQKSLWQTAPKLEDYRQVRDDKDMVEAARENEKRYPDSPSAKMRRAAAEFQQIRSAISRQKAYDKATVKAVTDFAQEFMKMGFGDNLTRGEMERMLSSVKNATGAKDIRKSVDNIMNILSDNYLRNLEQQVVKLSSTKELSKTAQGVEKQGRLELKGQRMIQAFREAREGRMDAVKIRERMADVAERMNRSDDEAPMWEQDYEGLSIALQYEENIGGSRTEWADLDREYKDAVAEYKNSGRSYKEQQELLESLEQAMQENKIERIGLYGDIIGRLQGNISESMKGAREFVEREKQRQKRIWDMVNFDLAGKEMGAMREKVKGKPANFFMLPLGTFEQMLRLFGSRNASGEGYLYNHFVRGWMDATDNAYIGEQKAKGELDQKAREVFGGKVRRWSDLYTLERGLPTMEVEMLDGGERKTFTLTQGNLLYIYMADKMADGRMKLRKMGIDEEKVEAVRDFLDPRIRQLGDWLQEEYLPGKRTAYNKVHERMFGAPMAAIDSYFPLKVLGDARYQEQDVNVPDGEALPSTITGNIIKRTKNALPLDILHTDALSLAIEHIEDMEHWAAQAEWNRDVNTLLSYTTFRNKVKNMKTVYGSGDALWNAFKDAAKMAAGAYDTGAKSGHVDKAISNIAKGVTAAKINFRVYTAFKQILSAPAFLHDVNLADFLHDGVNPYGSWKWAMENMPVFRKRWESRQVGDTRLMDDATDWKMWKNDLVKKATMWGMSPNALVDGVTCAVGARAIYKSRYRKYKEIGASDELAHKRALQDAEIGYNLTQQSSEGAFVSTIQMDRTVAANMLSVFRNSSMAYTRQWWDASRNLKRRMQKGYREDSIKFMTGQIQKEFGLDETQARKAAEAEYARAGRRDVARMLNMMFGVTVAWNLGASLPYLLLGDDNETKMEMMTDALLKGLLAGPTEGFATGNIISDFVGVATDEGVRNAFRDEGLWGGFKQSMKNMGEHDVNPLPLFADMERMIGKMKSDEWAAAQDVFNICVQSAVGVNPQTFTDMWNAVMDYAAPGWDGTSYTFDKENMANAKEIALFMMRFFNAPVSSWRNKYIDELGMNAEDAKKLPYEEMARRYAHYKHWKDAPIMGWLRGEEGRREKMDKIQKQFDKAVVERMERLDGMELRDNFRRSQDLEERRMLGQTMAKRALSADRDGQKPKTDWQRAYQKWRTYEDAEEGIRLYKMKQDARKRGDDATYKAIDGIQKKITEKKKLLIMGDKPGQDYMEEIRQLRRRALELALKAESKAGNPD